MRTPFEHATTNQPASFFEIEAVEQFWIEGAPSGRAKVHIPVDHIPVGRRFRRQPPAGHRLHPRGMGIYAFHFPEPAGAGQFAGEREMGQIAPLRARLKHPPGAADRVFEDQALGDVLGAGLLAVHILPGAGSGHRRGAMPVGTGGDQHRIDVIPIEEFAEVAVHGAVLRAIPLVGDLLDRDPPVLLDVAHRGELHILLFEEAAQIVGTAAADADAAENHTLARWHGAIQAKRRTGNHHRRNRRGPTHEACLQKTAPGQPTGTINHGANS